MHEHNSKKTTMRSTNDQNLLVLPLIVFFVGISALIGVDVNVDFENFQDLVVFVGFTTVTFVRLTLPVPSAVRSN